MSGKYALIIGNTEYIDSGLAQLTAPGKDAQDFARVLKDKEICAFDEVNVLLNQPEYIVRGTIDEFFDQKKPDDLLVLYFSGHGVRDELGALYLAVKNTIRTRLRSTAIKSDYIREAMDQSRSKRQVLILDCCNSGAFTQGVKAELGGTMGMVSALQGRGRFVLTASDATQFAWEGDKVIGETQNSLFTHFLVRGLEGEADNDGDGKITVDELYDYAHDQISSLTPKQTPTKSVSIQEGEIILRQFTRIEDIKAVSLSEQLVSEIENPYPEVRLRAIGQLAKLVAGKNLGLARSAREALERLAKEDDSHRVVLAAKQALASAGQLGDLVIPKIKAESSQPAKKKAEEDPITQPRIKADLKANADTEQERKARERLNAIQAAREREQLERQLKLQQKSTTTAVPEKKVQEQRPSQQSNGRKGFMLGGVGLILLACVFGLVYASSHWPFPIPQPNSPTPTITEPAATLTSQPTDTAVTPPTAASTTEAPPTPTKVNTPPQLFLPGNISREGDTIGGAVISYQVSATDAEDGLIPVDCAPRSGSLFSVDSTSVNCSATDSQGAKTNNSFTIEVKDTTPPTIASHEPVNVQATSDSGAIVTYTNPTASDIVDGTITPICSPPSGGQFRIGDTTITCTASDSHGNPATPATFVVHVTPPPNSSIVLFVYWDRNNNGLYKNSDDWLITGATLELYTGSSCSGTVLATAGEFLGYIFSDLSAGTYCVKVINNSIDNGGECALVPRGGLNTKVYTLNTNERYEDLGTPGRSGFPYVCQ